MVKVCLLALIILMATLPRIARSTVRITSLRCEYQTNPLGIDSSSPRLSWVLESDERGLAQHSYEVLASSSIAKLKRNDGDLWSSGKTLSSTPFNVAYGGIPLKSGERVYWKVRIFDEQERASRWSETAFFEMGLLHESDWTGKWINDGKSNPLKDEDFYKEDPAPLFRKEFQIGKRVLRATLYIAGLGYYEVGLNGRKVGDHVLDPGWTKFGTRVFYSTFDVTDHLHAGENCIGVMLGNGWYNPLPLRMFGQFNLRDHLDVGRPRFIGQLNVEFVDGSSQSIVSDTDWKVGEGAIRFDNVYLGEVVDARKDANGWMLPGFRNASWTSPTISNEPIGRLQAQPQPPIRVTESIAPIRCTEPQPRVFIYDFGQEFAGWASLRLQAPAGTKVLLRYGELLHADGTLNPMTSVAGQIKFPRKNAQGIEESGGGPGAPLVAVQSDTYIAKGSGDETYTPHFTFHGFRYLELTGLKGPLSLEHVTGLRLNSDVKDAGSFSCSNDNFNRIQEMCRRTFLSNIFSVQSDCPHRERLGYGGDIVGTSEAFLLNFDMATFYAKAAQDFSDAALPDGMMTDTAPFIGIQYCGVGWAMAQPVLTEQLQKYYGDHRTMEQEYAAAKRWLLLVSDQYKDGIVKDGLSDHEALEPNPSPEMVTPLFFQSARLLSAMAAELGHKDDAALFEELAQKIRIAYNSVFVDSASGKIGPGTQGSQAFALYSDLLSPADRSSAIRFLLDRIRNVRNGHLETGLMGTKYMLDVLSREGHAEDAYRIVNQPDFPGWIWMLKNGATTLWEHWEKEEMVYSHCHPMFGSVSQWFISWLGGIQQAPDSVGFDRIVIRPQFVKDLNWVRSSHTCMFGKIVSNWRRDKGGITLEVEIPVGATGTVYIPGKSATQLSESGNALAHANGILSLKTQDSNQVVQVSSGRYTFSIPTERS